MRKLSFCIMDNLNIIEEYEYEFEHDAEIKHLLNNIWDKFTKGKKEDPGKYFFISGNQESDIHDVERRLKINKYCVFNNFQKYFVYAFAIDYTRFYVWSKGFNPSLISWPHDFNQISKIIRNY